MKTDIEILQELLNKASWTDQERQWLRSYLETNDAQELYLLLRSAFGQDLFAGRTIDPKISRQMRQHIFLLTGKVAVEQEQLPNVRPGASRGFLFRFGAWRSAAAITLLIATGWMGYRAILAGIANKKSKKTTLVTNTATKRENIAPGGNKAILQLSNGAVIALDSSTAKGVLAQGDAQMINNHGKLSYSAATNGAAAGSATDANTSAATAALAYNVLSTPRGGEYQVILQDGTHVWLNAVSSLKYPAVFGGKERVVELMGEAYFEVAKDPRRPFRVLIPGHQLEINVLGTGFDVMAYEEEKAIQTTLVEGSVRLSKNGNSVQLKPGEQGVLDQNASGFRIDEADLEQTLAWKNGMFQFDNLDIQTIMRQVARWYDVDVSYAANLQKQVYSGTIPRTEDIHELLMLLEYTGTVHFTVKGSKITVTK